MHEFYNTDELRLENAQKLTQILLFRDKITTKTKHNSRKTSHYLLRFVCISCIRTTFLSRLRFWSSLAVSSLASGEAHDLRLSRSTRFWFLCFGCLLRLLHHHRSLCDVTQQVAPPEVAGLRCWEVVWKIEEDRQKEHSLAAGAWTLLHVFTRIGNGRCATKGVYCDLYEDIIAEDVLFCIEIVQVR